MKKSELEAQKEAYYERLAEAEKSEESGMYRAAVQAALSAWEFIDGMIQYERRYESRDFESIPAIDMVLKYGPLLLDQKCLSQLQALLAQNKRIVRATSTEDELAQARERIWDNHRIWSYLEANPGARQADLHCALGGNEEYWRWVVEMWEKMGLLRRISAGPRCGLSLATRMGEVVPGKCPACGMRIEAPKAMLLPTADCPECKARVSFVILSATVSSKG